MERLKDNDLCLLKKSMLQFICYLIILVLNTYYKLKYDIVNTKNKL
jgi:hypothetical protein